MKRKPFPVVAIADNDPDDQLLLERAFEECRPDVEIHFFEDAEKLLDFLYRSHTYRDRVKEPDLIIIDLHLPGMNGLDLIEEIKTTPDLKRIPFIVLTGSPSDAEIRRCYELGTNTVITKPNLFDELVQTLKAVCHYWFGPVRM